MAWQPTIYERQNYASTWNSIYSFVEYGLLHQRQQGNNSYASATLAAISEARVNSRSPVARIGFKLTGIKNLSCYSNDDFEELLNKAAYIVDCFKNNSVKNDKLSDAIFRLIYVYILPFIPIFPSDEAVISQIIYNMDSPLQRSSYESSAATAIQTSRELKESEENNRNRMMLQIMECSSEVSNNQILNYFLVAESGKNNKRFSYGIFLGSRSLQEIIFVTIGKNFEASKNVKNLGKKLLRKMQLKLRSRSK